MNKENCALKLVDEIILYYDARSKKHHIIIMWVQTHNLLLSVHLIATSRQATRCSLLLRNVQTEQRTTIPRLIAGSNDPRLYAYVLCLSSLWVQESSVARPNTQGAGCCMSKHLKHIDPWARVGVALPRCSLTSVKKCRRCCALCEAVALTRASSWHSFLAFQV